MYLGTARESAPGARQLWFVVDLARLLRGCLEHVVDLAQAHRQAQQVAQELDDAAV